MSRATRALACGLFCAACGGEKPPEAVAPAPIATVAVADSADGSVQDASILPLQIAIKALALTPVPPGALCTVERPHPSAISLGAQRSFGTISVHDPDARARVSLLPNGDQFAEVTAPKIRANGYVTHELRLKHDIVANELVTLLAGSAAYSLRDRDGHLVVDIPTAGLTLDNANATEITCDDLTIDGNAPLASASTSATTTTKPPKTITIGSAPRKVSKDPGGKSLGTVQNVGPIEIVDRKGAFIKVTWTDASTRVTAWTTAAAPYVKPKTQQEILLEALDSLNGGNGVYASLNGGYGTGVLNAGTAPIRHADTEPAETQKKLHCPQELTLSVRQRAGGFLPLATIKDADLVVFESANGSTRVKVSAPFPDTTAFVRDDELNACVER